MEPVKDRIFHTKQDTDFKGRENQFDIQVLAIALNKMAIFFWVIAEKWPVLYVLQTQKCCRFL